MSGNTGAECEGLGLDPRVLERGRPTTIRTNECGRRPSGGREQRVEIQGHRGQQGLDDVAAILAGLIALARVDLSGETVVARSEHGDDRMQRLSLVHADDDPVSSRLVRTTDPTGKKLIAFTNALTSAVLSFVPASRASTRQACSGGAGCWYDRAPVIAS